MGKMKEEALEHLKGCIIPFWKGLHDETGGFYGYVDHDLKVDKQAVKGCILNNRILWFFSNAYRCLKDESLKKEAEHAFIFLKDHCLDSEKGGVYWSLTAAGKPFDTTKHTYNQAFAIYGLSSYYEISKDEEAKKLAYELYDLIEGRMRDRDGYLEAFDRDFNPAGNEKLSENGVEAKRSMNTLLHVMEAYTELYRVDRNEKLAANLREILEIIEKKIYNPKLKRQEVFFDLDYNSLIDLCSYGHDIEAAWLINRTVDILGDKEIEERISPLTASLAENIYNIGFVKGSIPSEEEKGVVKTERVWWVQAEGVNGFLDAYKRDPSKKEYLKAAKDIWQFIRDKMVDPRKGSEWFWRVDENGRPDDMPIVEPWKCPYHNGRMCLEVITQYDS